MRARAVRWPVIVAAAVGATGLLMAAACLGCAGGSAFQYYWQGTPYLPGATTSGSAATPGSSGRSPGALDGGSRGDVDPCDEPQERKFIRISMRSQVEFDYVHYFLVLIANIRSETYPDGAVCSDDTDIYRSFGYTLVQEGGQVAFGNLCIQGPALYYFHRSGQFRGTGATGLASAIAPAQGSTASYDGFFGPTGARVPVPNFIIFHNPGLGSAQQALKYSDNMTAPCNPTTGDTGDPPCQQDGFYYVDDLDTRSGVVPTAGNRAGSYVRFPDEIQGTECYEGASNNAWATLAPSGATAASAEDWEFLRGGQINFVFIRNDTDPPIPQLVWRVTDSSGARAHDYDPRADVQ